MKIKINPAFKKLIPPLSEEEYLTLEKSIISEGVRDAIVTWRGFIIDGHNRYEIAQEHGFEFRTIEHVSDSEEDVKVWMIDNQKGRRNLTDFVKFELADLKADILRDKGKKKLIESGSKGRQIQLGGLSIIDKGPEHNTRKEVAKDLGWSTGKVAMAEVVKKKAPEEVKQQLRNNEVSINQIYKEITVLEKKKARTELIDKQVEQIEAGELPELIGKFHVIAIDPPWPYGREYNPEGSRVANPYPEMTIEDIKAIDVPSTDDSVLWLWTTHQFLFEAKEILDHWGYTYKATMVWNKEKMGMGAWLRMQCEFCLLGVKGTPAWNSKSIRDIITEPRREHSRKPDKFYSIVDEVCYGRKLEYFSRSPREGWEIFGNDINKF